MSKRRALRKKVVIKVNKPVILYRLVFSSLITRGVILIILSFFALQPVAAVYANMNETQTTKTIEEVSEVGSAEELPETVVEDDVMREVEATADPEAEVTDEPEETVLISPATTSSSTTDELEESETLELVPPNTDTISIVSTTTLATTTDTLPQSEEVHSTTTDPEISVGDEVVLPQTETLPDVELPAEADTKIEEDPTIDQPTNVIEAQSIVINNDNGYQFGERDCVSVGEDAFYCSNSTTTSTVKTTDGVYSEMDNDGDSEIYFVDDGHTIKLSENKADDLAPYYDPESHSVVWHRLIDGRYQIVSYDLDDQEETILTHSSVNNMEPTRSGDHTVWQRWVNDNWDIVLFDGKEERLITNSKAHDVAPAVRNDYVIWHTTDDKGEKILSVYEIATGYTSAIADPDGGHVQNPRFVLVYDTSFENGDIITKQYDPTTGEIKPVGSFPAPLPPPVIPEPDSTGETRALITSKSSSRDENIIDSDEPVTKPATDQTGTPTATSTAAIGDVETDIADIDLSSSTPETVDFSLTEFDVIVPPYQSTSSSLIETDAATSTES